MDYKKGIIIGGGIGGLTTAIGLLKLGIDIDVYEATPEIREVGAGIWLAPNAMKVYHYLDLAEEIEKNGFLLGSVELRHYTDMGVITRMDQDRVREKTGFGTIAIHRANLVKVLANHIPIERIHLGKRLDRVEQKDGKVQAFFEDGTSVESDFLIGADGIKSKVRQSIFPESKIRYSGQTCWRGIAHINADKLLGIQATEIWGKASRFGLSRINEDDVYWFACKDASRGGKDVDGNSREILLGILKDFAAPVADVLMATPNDKIMRNDLDDLLSLPSWSKGNILLIGDAAHATTPNMGQGGGQAIEDAWYLYGLFQADKDIEDIFRTFYQRRHKRVNGIVRQSYMMGKLAHLKYGKRLRNAIFRMTPASVMEKQFLEMYTIPSLEEVVGM